MILLLPGDAASLWSKLKFVGPKVWSLRPNMVRTTDVQPDLEPATPEEAMA